MKEIMLAFLAYFFVGMIVFFAFFDVFKFTICIPHHIRQILLFFVGFCFVFDLLFQHPKSVKLLWRWANIIPPPLDATN